MSSYQKWMKKGPARTGSPKADAAGPKKRQRSAQVGEGSTTPASSPPVFTIEDDSTHVPEPVLVPSSFGDAVFLEPGELWKTGVSDGLRAVVTPPPGLVAVSPLSASHLADLSRVEEDAMKAASLVQSFKDLHIRLETSSSSAVALSLRVDELLKERSEVQAQLDQATLLKSEVTTLKEKLKKTEDDLVSSKATLVEKDASLADKEADLEKMQADLKRMEGDVDEARDMISKAAIEAFDNAMAQAKVLNPDLVIDGMDVFASVKDGRIVPGSPVGEEEDVHEE